MSVTAGERRVLLEALPLAAAVIDETGSLVVVGTRFAEAVGHPQAAIEGRPLADLAAPVGDLPLALHGLAATLGSATWEGPVLDADGDEAWHELTVGPVGGWGAGQRVVQLRPLPDRWRAQMVEARRLATRLAAQAATVEGALAAILQPIAETLDFDVAAAWTDDPETAGLRCASVWRSAAASQPGAERRPAAGDGRWARRSREAGGAVGGEDRTSRRTGDYPRGAAFPVRAGAETVAVVELLSVRRRAIPLELLDALSTLGVELAEVLMRKRAASLDRPGNELLLVEDNALIARLVREMLADFDEGLELVHVEHLAVARERLATWRPACVLLDLTLPDAHGLQALVEIRKLAPEVPIVVLTGQDDDELAVRAVQEGAQDYLSKRRVDMESLVRSIRYAIERKGAEQERLERRLRDRLTGLPSRLLFLDRLRVALRRNGPGAVAILLLNLDRFRLINDSLGHESGDHLLRETAQRLVAAAGSEVTIAGFGADEFAVLVERDEAELHAIDLAGRLAQAVASPTTIAGELVAVQATIGIAINHGVDLDALALVEQADTAMSRGKHLGGSRFEIFDRAVRERLREQLQLESGIRQAIEGQQLRLHYQPLVSLDAGLVFGFEALVRWQHPERGLLGPAAFMAAAEQTGLVVGLGRWVMAEACRQLATWRRSLPGGGGLAMNVNLSARQLADPGLLADLMACVEREALRPGDVCLEVTETALIEDIEGSEDAIARLKDRGFRLALDDFGTGYCSLSYLQRFAVDLIKLDRSFVAALRDRGEAAIVAAVARMGEALGLPVLAEGVEEEPDVERLRGLGYGQAQGYWFGKPQPPEEIEAVIHQSGGLRVAS